MPLDYLAVRTVHESAVAVSVTGFAVRGAAALGGAAWVRGRLARTLPHVVDTVLLGSAIAMLAILRLNPFLVPWLQAKLVGLVVYIGLGAVALRPTLPRPVRGAAWLAALCTVAWIVSVAFTKSPLGFLRPGMSLR